MVNSFVLSFDITAMINILQKNMKILHEECLRQKNCIDFATMHQRIMIH